MKKPNLLFVLSDQQRRQALGFMNQDPVLTPHLDDFAAQSVVFNNALACCPIYTPNRASLLTGCYPTTTGVLVNNDSLPPAMPTFGLALQDAGYFTGYIGKWHIYGGGGQAQVPREQRGGFDFWHGVNCNHNTFTRLYFEESEQPVVHEMGWQPEHETAVALRFLRGRSDSEQPFALFLSWTPPHNTHGSGFERHAEVPLPPEFERGLNAAGYSKEVQYRAPEPWEAPYAGRELPRRSNVPDDYGREFLPVYFGACTGLDFHFGQLMEFLKANGLAENTIVFYTSDHGEMLGSHVLVQKMVWHEESVGVPFLLRWPAQLAPRHTDVLLNSVDNLPTILGLMGVEIPQGVEGRDLSQLVREESSAEPPVDALLGYYGMTRKMLDERGGDLRIGWRALRTKSHCFVANLSREGELQTLLYDLQNDPFQMAPLCDESSALSAQLQNRLAARLDEVNDPFRTLL